MVRRSSVRVMRALRGRGGRWIGMLAALSALTIMIAGGALAEESAQFFAMDTVMNVTAYDGESGSAALCRDLAEGLEALFSVTSADSEIARLNAKGEVKASPETLTLLSSALEYAEKTGGALDPTVYPLVRAWGFTTGEYRVPEVEELTALMPLVDWRQVEIDGETIRLPEGVQVDLGSVAKGYAADRMEALLRERGVTGAKLDLGGNIQCVGAKPDGSAWRIGVRDPVGDGLVCAISVKDGAVVTSGCYERYFEQDGVRYGHIIDPGTGRPVANGVLSVTIVTDSGLTGDALSTALFILGPEGAETFWRQTGGFEFVMITEDGVRYTEGLEGAIRPMGDYVSGAWTMIGR